MAEYVFGERSLENLAGCNINLQDVARKALEISTIDFMVICGFRSQEAQTEAFQSGHSKTPWPKSKHNHHRISPVYKEDSLALDFVPYIAGRPVDWKDHLIFAVVASSFLSAGKILQVPIRWGGDWDSDGSTRDQTFMDLGHVEIDR